MATTLRKIPYNFSTSNSYQIPTLCMLNKDGTLLALSGTFQSNGMNNKVKIYREDSGGAFQLEATLNSPELYGHNDHFGGFSSLQYARYEDSVSFSADSQFISVGATMHFDDQTGYVVVFEHDGSGNWNQRGDTILGSVSGEKLGWKTVLNSDGSVLFASTASYGMSVKVRKYDWDGTNYVASGHEIDTGSNNNNQGDFSSFDVTSDMSRLCVGAETLRITKCYTYSSETGFTLFQDIPNAGRDVEMSGDGTFSFDERQIG